MEGAADGAGAGAAAPPNDPVKRCWLLLLPAPALLPCRSDEATSSGGASAPFGGTTKQSSERCTQPGRMKPCSRRTSVAASQSVSAVRRSEGSASGVTPCSLMDRRVSDSSASR